MNAPARSNTITNALGAVKLRVTKASVCVRCVQHGVRAVCQVVSRASVSACRWGAARRVGLVTCERLNLFLSSYEEPRLAQDHRLWRERAG